MGSRRKSDINFYDFTDAERSAREQNHDGDDDDNARQGMEEGLHHTGLDDAQHNAEADGHRAENNALKPALCRQRTDAVLNSQTLLDRVADVGEDFREVAARPTGCFDRQNHERQVIATHPRF